MQNCRDRLRLAAEGAVLDPEQPAKEDTAMGPGPEDASISTLKRKAVGKFDYLIVYAETGLQQLITADAWLMYWHLPGKNSR